VTDPSTRPLVHWGLTPFRLLLLGTVAFFAVSFTMSWLRAVELQTSTWDMGLYQQGLWTTAHGRVFYETADVETGGYASLLQVHTVLLFYLIAPIYGALPSQATLFAIQSAVVAVAAVPLYFLTRDITRDPWLGLLAGVVYLAWTPVLSSTMYDFHPEAFLPLELFALALFWHRGQFVWGGVAAAVAAATFELAPVLTFFFAVFALVPATWTWSVLRAPEDSRAPGPGWLDRAHRWMAEPRVRASLVLLVASVAAYEFLVWLRVEYLIATLGTYPVPQAPTGYVIGNTPAALGLSLSNLATGFETKVTYWLLALALLAFIPLLAPRALLLAVPWFGFTMLSGNLNYVTLGFQYGFLVASALLVAFAYGLPEARRLVLAWRDRPAVSPARGPPASSRQRRRVGVLVAVAVLIGVNLALTPLNPALQNAGLGAGYRVTYTVPAGYSGVQDVVAMIPAGAVVIASDDLFPLVANDPNAYSFLWTVDPTLALPFTPDHLPPYVLLSAQAASAVPPWLTALLYDRSAFGVRAVVWSTAVGTVLLFETSFSGAPTTFGSPPDAGGTYYGASIAASPLGLVSTARDSTYPSVVTSAPGALGTVWQGPDGSILPGNYTVRVSLNASAWDGLPTPSMSTPVLWIGAYAFGQTFYGWYWPWGTFQNVGWTTIEFNVTVAEPTIDFNVQGTLLVDSVETTLNYVQMAADPPVPAP